MTLLSTGAMAQSEETAPQGHLTIEDPGQITAEEAEQAYQKIIRDLSAFYALSQEDSARRYLRWPRLNKVPYLSATHGNRYVNNYYNAKGQTYTNLQKGIVFPAGTIMAKDSFTVTEEGEIFGAAFFIMEKLPAGTDPSFADWRYAMILPDGSFEGDSRGDNAEAMAYCYGCHISRKNTDYVFGVPDDVMRQ